MDPNLDQKRLVSLQSLPSASAVGRRQVSRLYICCVGFCGPRFVRGGSFPDTVLICELPTATLPDALSKPNMCPAREHL